MILIALLRNASTAETLLNNLAEVEFDLADVSIVMRDLTMRDALTGDAGPLKGVRPDDLIDRLTTIGLSPDQAQTCGEAVARGGALVALTCSAQMRPVVVEMLKDHAAQIIEEKTHYHA